MANRTRVVIGGVDTHGRTHHAAVIDQHGRLLADAEFGAHSDGYRQLLSWLRRHGQLSSVGVEGTGTYGAGLTRFLLERGVQVLEADRPNRTTRRRRGKSDPVDAEAAARAVLAGTATALPKRRDGIVEAIRVLRGVRAGAVKARTAAINQLKAMVITAPALVREPLDGRSTARQVAACARLRPDLTQLADPVQATKAALRAVAARILALEQEIKVADQRLGELVPKAAPRTLGCWRSASSTPGSCWSPPATTPSGYAVRPPSPTCAGRRRSRPPADAPGGIGCTAAAIATPTARCTWPWWSACATALAPAPTSSAGPRKGCPSRRSCGA
jgi:transposase